MHAKFSNFLYFLFFALHAIISRVNKKISKKITKNYKKIFFFAKKSGKVSMLFMIHLIHKEIDRDGKNLYR